MDGTESTANGGGAPETALTRVKAMLGRTVRILLSDGRVIQGEFQVLYAATLSVPSIWLRLVNKWTYFFIVH
jgi:hypothetical protein